MCGKRIGFQKQSAGVLTRIRLAHKDYDGVRCPGSGRKRKAIGAAGVKAQSERLRRAGVAHDDSHTSGIITSRRAGMARNDVFTIEVRASSHTSHYHNPAVALGQAIADSQNPDKVLPTIAAPMVPVPVAEHEAQTLTGRNAAVAAMNPAAVAMAKRATRRFSSLPPYSATRGKLAQDGIIPARKLLVSEYGVILTKTWKGATIEKCAGYPSGAAYLQWLLDNVKDDGLPAKWRRKIQIVLAAKRMQSNG